MNTTLEKLEDNRVRITITHTTEEVATAVKGAYSRISRQVKIQGFRPGRAPRPVIDTHVGRESVLAEALQQLVDQSYTRAIEEHRVRPIENPDTGELDLLEEGKEYTYTAEVGTRPELTLSSVEDLKATTPSTATTDAEIDAQIEQLRSQHATLDAVEDRGIEEKDFALVSFQGNVDGSAAEDLKIDKYLYELGQGVMPIEFDAGLIGAKPGDKVQVEFEVPDSVANPDYSGKQAVFDVEVFEIKVKVMPEIDDEFATNATGLESLAELREDIRRHLDENKMAAHVRLAERGALAALAERLVGDVPDQLISTRARTMTDEFFQNLGGRGMSPDDYMQATGLSIDDVYADMAAEAGIRVREELALEALYRQVGLEFTDEEVDEEIASLAQSNEIEAAVMRERLIDAGAMAIVRERLAHRHATNWLMEHVEFVEERPEESAAAETPKKKASASKKKRSKKSEDAGS